MQQKFYKWSGCFSLDQVERLHVKAFSLAKSRGVCCEVLVEAEAAKVAVFLEFWKKMGEYGLEFSVQSPLHCEVLFILYRGRHLGWQQHRDKTPHSRQGGLKTPSLRLFKAVCNDACMHDGLRNGKKGKRSASDHFHCPVSNCNQS